MTEHAEGGGHRPPPPADPDTSEDCSATLRRAERNEQGIPAPPDGLDAAGVRLWRAVTDIWELTEVELVLLGEAARCADLCDALEARVVADGPMVTDSRGTRANPAAVEVRQQRITLARLLAALRVPLDEVDPGGAVPRSQRRVGVRGFYSLGGEG